MDTKHTKLDAYVGPINSNLFPHLTIFLLGTGFIFTAWFFVYTVTTVQKSRSLLKELTTASLASTFLGFGVVFLLLWVGIYL